MANPLAAAAPQVLSIMYRIETFDNVCIIPANYFDGKEHVLGYLTAIAGKEFAYKAKMFHCEFVDLCTEPVPLEEPEPVPDVPPKPNIKDVCKLFKKVAVSSIYKWRWSNESKKRREIVHKAFVDIQKKIIAMELYKYSFNTVKFFKDLLKLDFGRVEDHFSFLPDELKEQFVLFLHEALMQSFRALTA